MPTIPSRAADLTATWFSEVLGSEVLAIKALDEAQATNQRLRLALTYAEGESGPASVFVKLPPSDPEHREMIGANGMGEREVRFYSDAAPLIELRIPRCHWAATADNGDFAIVLEDLAASGARFSNGEWGLTADTAAGAMEGLGRFHARFSDPGARSAAIPWSAQHRQRWSEFIVGLLRSVLAEHRAELSADYVAVGTLYADQHERVEDLWEDGPQTYIHGDPHIGNVFLDADRVGFHDWGLSRVGNPLRDVSYFLTQAVEPEDRHRYQRDLLRTYLDALEASGGPRIGYAEAWFGHRVQAAYTVLSTFLVFMPGYAAPEAQFLGADLLQRAEQAVEDLEVADALRRALGSA